MSNYSEDIQDLKRDIFYSFLDQVGRVFVVVKYGGTAIIGNRGFLDEEKEHGVTLVFNSKMKFVWDDNGIQATLVFGSSAEKCLIPTEDIIAVYSPELGAQFIVTPKQDMPDEDEKETHEKPHTQKDGNIIKVDFKKKDD